MDCHYLMDVQRPIADREKGPEEDCPGCGHHTWDRTIEVPNFTRKTFLDGGRKSDKNFQDAKRALQLEVDSARSNNQDDKKQMKQEINKLRTVKK